MSFGNSVRVNQVATGTGQGVKVLTQVGAIVGFGSGTGDYGDNVPTQMRNLSEIKDNYGIDSAIYKAAELVSLNAGGLGDGLFIVQHEAGSLQSDTSQTGDGSTKEFTVVGVTTQMLRGSVIVKVDAVTQTEGTDYIIDYSNDKIHFSTAPPNLDALSFEWKEATTTHIDNALAELETKIINFVIIAYVFDSTLLARLNTHLVATESADFLRGGFMCGKYLEYTNILTLATANDNKRVWIFSNRSGWKGTSNQNWLEFRDPSAIAMGLCMNPSVTPGVDLHEKQVRGYNLYGQFTQTQIGSYSGATGLLGKGINVFFASRWKGGTGVSLWKGYTNDQTRAVPYINKQRSYDYADHEFKATLTPYMGNVKIALRGDMEKVAGAIWFKAMQFFRERIVNDPAILPFTHDLEVIDWELLRILRKKPIDRTTPENDFVTSEENSNESEINVNLDFLSGLHTITLNLALLS